MIQPGSPFRGYRGRAARIGNEYTYAHQDIADALTDYCKANNLGTGISEASVRRYRKAQR